MTFAIRYLQVTLSNIYEFSESRRREGRSVHNGVNKIHLGMYCETAWHFENKECLGEERVLRHGVHSLHSLSLFF